MGARGPQPKPTYLRVLEGNPGKRPFNPHEAQVPIAQTLPPPRGFTEAKITIWNEVCEDLAAMRGLSKVDRKMLALYVDTLYECERLIEKINSCPDSVIPVYGRERELNPKTGKMERVAIGMKTLPYTQQLRSQKEIALKFAMHFGMTPASRAKIVFLGNGGKPTEADPFDI